MEYFYDFCSRNERLYKTFYTSHGATRDKRKPRDILLVGSIFYKACYLLLNGEFSDTSPELHSVKLRTLASNLVNVPVNNHV